MQRARTFLVERYLPELRAADVEALGGRLATATAEMRREGRRVEWVRSLGIPGDEACVCSFRAASAADVDEANARAGAAYERIVEAMPVENARPAEL